VSGLLALEATAEALRVAPFFADVVPLVDVTGVLLLLLLLLVDPPRLFEAAAGVFLDDARGTRGCGVFAARLVSGVFPREKLNATSLISRGPAPLCRASRLSFRSTRHYC
jgi:hypothetical protein